MRARGGQVISNMSRPPQVSCLLYRKRSSIGPTRMSSGMLCLSYAPERYARGACDLGNIPRNLFSVPGRRLGQIRHQLDGIMPVHSPQPATKEMPMLHNPPMLTIHRGHRRPEKSVIEAFRGVQTSHV